MNYRTGLAVVIGLFTLSSCKDDPEPPVEINFAIESQMVTEGNQIAIFVDFDRPVHSAGKVTVQLAGTASYTEDYNTNPSGNSGSFEISFAAGAESAQFMVATVDNEIFKGNLEIEFTLANLQGEFVLGSVKTMKLAIQENESQAVANFLTATASVAEDSAPGITIQIPFSEPAQGPGSITISMASVNAVYTTHYTTLPVATSNTIILQVPDAATESSLTLIPKDDSFFHENYVIVIEMTSATGSVRIGTVNKVIVTIQEDENPSFASFSLSDGTIHESNSSGFIVPIGLSIPASETGSMTISFSSANATYGSHFTTEPAASGANIVINVAKDDTGAQLKIIPVDNAGDNPDRMIFFTVSSGSGVVRPGGNINFVISIIDNEPTLMRVLVSFGSATAPLVTGTDVWNHAYTNIPDPGVSWNNMKRADGMVTPYDLSIVSPLTPQPLGKTTGINSGAFPDNAMKEYWYVPGPSQGISRSFSILQLDNDREYTIRVHGGTTFVSGDGRNTMTISINGVQKSIENVTDNVSQVLEWTAINPVASIFTITLTDTDGGGICPINALELSWYED